MVVYIRRGILIAIIGLVSFLIQPEAASAQKIGVGFMYGDQIENVGARLEAQYRFHKLFRFTGDIAAYLTKEFEQQGGKWNWWAVNTNVDFVFLDIGLFRSYALVGANYANLMHRLPNSGGREIDSQMGLNVGGGLEYKTSFGSFFGEYRYTFTKETFQQYEINTGLRFYIGGGR